MPTKRESATDVERWFRDQAANLWPAALGSLCFRRSPCVREHCPACLRGERHPSYVLYGRKKGRRFALHIPDELVPEMQRSLDNGRALQELLHQTAMRYAKALKDERTARRQKGKK
jgi:hypothetical protein